MYGKWLIVHGEWSSLATSPCGRGALILHRSRTVRSGGAVSSENAGMSNHKTCENHVGRKSKVS